MGGREQLIFVFLVVGHKNLVGGFFQVRGSKFLAAGGGFPPPPPPPPLLPVEKTHRTGG